MLGEAIIVLTTCGDREVALGISRKLVGGQLAACVNIVPNVESVYRWNGDIEESHEVMLLIKTTHAHFDAVADVIRSGSNYELPEVLAVPVSAGCAAYLDWFAASLKN